MEIPPSSLSKRTVVLSSLVIVLVLLTGFLFSVSTASAQQDVTISNASVSPEDPVTGESVTITPTVENLDSSNGTVEVTDLYIRESGSPSDLARLEDLGSLSPGNALSPSLDVSFDEAGEKNLRVHAVFETDSGDYQSVEYPLIIDVEDEDVDTGLSTSVDESNGTETVVTDFTNFGNSELTNIEISASQNGEEVARELITSVDAESSQSVEFDTDDFEEGEVTFTAEYESDATDESYTETTSLDTTEYGEVEGEIDLSGVEAVQEDDRVTIEGDAANIGSTDAESVQLSVRETAEVSPVSPSGEYFIGTVEGSEFDTFELTAETDSNVSSVPVEISYIVDNERVTTTQDVAIESMRASAGSDGAQVADEDGEQGSAGSPSGPLGGLPLIAGTVIAGLLVVAVGIGVYRWRSQ